METCASGQVMIAFIPSTEGFEACWTCKRFLIRVYFDGQLSHHINWHRLSDTNVSVDGAGDAQSEKRTSGSIDKAVVSYDEVCASAAPAPELRGRSPLRAGL